MIARVTDHSNDLVVLSLLSPPSHTQMLSNGILCREKLPNEFLVYDGIFVVLQSLILGKVAAADKGNLKRGEIVGIGRAVCGEVMFLSRLRRMLRNPEFVIAIVAITWYNVCKSGRLYARNMTYFLQ